jgi:Chlorite dismutase
MHGHYFFVGGEQGLWRVEAMRTLIGEPLQRVERVDVRDAQPESTDLDAGWVLRGFTSNTRYAERVEVDVLRAKQAAIGRPEMRCAALIPIRKTAAWWSLAQDERRTIFETQSRHITIGLDYLPQIARQLHHCRDIDVRFDFLTWFEFAPEHTRMFDDMLARLRETKEWEYVDREIDIRMTRTAQL